jgi:hypothetical protein
MAFVPDMENWLYILGIGGVLGLLLKLIDYVIKLLERREKAIREAERRSHEPERPRIRVDVAIAETSHPTRKTILVKILSLGSLPVTVNYGDVTVTSSQYPEPVIHEQFSRKEITTLHPIEIELPTKHGILHPDGVGTPEIKLVCKFSYGEDQQSYTEEQYYNQRTRKFENRVQHSLPGLSNTTP